MVFFPTASQLSASLDPHGSRYWVRSSAVDRIEKAVEKEIDRIKPKSPIPLFSTEYYKYCALGGLLACGITHAIVTPIDLAKVREQVDPAKYKSIASAWRLIVRADGVRGLFAGFGATFIGYSLQGSAKYGFYEVFKRKFADAVGGDFAHKYRTPIYLAASASAEAIADVLLCPWEAIKVRAQTTEPPFARNVVGQVTKFIAQDGVPALFKGLVPLWARQVPYTMVQFATFENIVQAIYAYLPKKKEEYSKVGQTGVSFIGGYIAGVFSAVASQPADIMVSKINSHKQEGEALGAAVSRIYKQIGFAGLWNGLGPRIFMIGTLTGLQFFIYDSFKAFVNLPTTGSAEITVKRS